MPVATDQGVPAGVMDHPPFLHHGAALPLCVLDGLDDPHQWNIIACWWTKKHFKFMTNIYNVNLKDYQYSKLINPFQR